MKNQQSCGAVVVHCIDFRFQNSLHTFLSSRFPQGYDVISLAGGVQELVEKEASSFTLQQLKISLQLHQPKTIVFIQHEDCGAYRGSKNFQSAEQELDFQRQELAKAEALLQKHLPGHLIETYFIRLSDAMVPLRG